MPSYVQQIFKYLGYFLAGLFFFGVLLDTISNAISLITPTVAVWGTGLIVLAWISFEIYVYLKGMPWRFSGGKVMNVKGLNGQVRFFVMGFIATLWIPSICNPATVPEEDPNIFKALFSEKDSISFNVLIIRFEDFANQDPNYCIGRSIEESLNMINQQEELTLPLITRYVDSIPPPKTIDKALQIQERHQADLIIYGLAKNVQEGCAGADVCFRYNIADKVIAQIAPVIEVNKRKHDLNYINTSSMDLEKGVLEIDDLSMKNWISSLIKVKAKEKEEAFIELDKIGMDTSLTLTDRAKRYADIGETYRKLKQAPKALQAYNKSIELTPDSVANYYNRGNIYLELKEYKKAITDYTKLIDLNPKNSTIGYNNRGLAYARMGQLQKAVFDFSHLITLIPDNELSYLNRGQIYSDFNQFENAIKDFTSFIELNPSNVVEFGYRYRGNIYAKMGRFQEAIADFEKAIELWPRNAEAYNSLASVYVSIKDDNKALLYFTKSININPDYAYPYNNRGNIYRKQKKFKKAKSDIQKSLSLDDNNGWAYATLAMIYADEGNKELFYKNCEIAISKPKPLNYPLKAKLKEEETLQQFENEPRFLELLNRTRK